MAALKQYLLRLLELCCEHNFGQNAIEWAITSGRIQLSYDLDSDLKHIMSQYDILITEYRRRRTDRLAA